MIAVYNGDLAHAGAIVAAANEAQLATLRSTLDFHQTASALSSEARREWIASLTEASHPVTYLVQLGLAAHVGEGATALDDLLSAIATGRPLAYNADDAGRGVARANLAAALFGVPTEVLRRDPRFAQVCAGLGLVAYWTETGDWPDCAADVAPWYDFRAECERAVAVL